MRYCGNCGASLNFGALASGRCPSCGATIGPSGEMIAPETPSEAAPMLPGDQGFPRQAWSGSTAPPSLQEPARRPASDRRRRLSGVAIVALIVAVVVLSGTLALGLTQWGRGNHTPSPSAATGSPGSATQTQVITPLTTASAQPSPSGQPTGTVTATGTPGDQPVLTVSPNPIVIPCTLTSTTFDVKNSGGGTLNWTATALGVAYFVNPPSGSLPAGQQQSVRITNILTLGGQIKVTAPGAANSPQYVTITCQIL